MYFSAKTLTLVAMTASTTLAVDVYSHFTNPTVKGDEITSTHFDVSNGGCFTVPNALMIYFSQSSHAQTATGPYCLSGWSQPNCEGHRVTQQFENVGLDNERYGLNPGVGNAASYNWKGSAC